MPKGPEIVGSIRYGGKVYRKGDEEALGEILQSNDDRKTFESLITRGLITGVDIPQAEEAQAPSEPNPGEAKQNPAGDKGKPENK